MRLPRRKGSLCTHSSTAGALLWVKKSPPKAQWANIKALYDEDTFQMLLSPARRTCPTPWPRPP